MCFTFVTCYYIHVGVLNVPTDILFWNHEALTGCVRMLCWESWLWLLWTISRYILYLGLVDFAACAIPLCFVLAIRRLFPGRLGWQRPLNMDIQVNSKALQEQQRWKLYVQVSFNLNPFNGKLWLLLASRSLLERYAHLKHLQRKGKGTCSARVSLGLGNRAWGILGDLRPMKNKLKPETSETHKPGCKLRG